MAQHTLLFASTKSGYGSVATASKATSQEHPDDTTLLSMLFFSFATPLIDEGNRRTLNERDMWELRGRNQIATAFCAFQRHTNRPRTSLFRVIMSAYGSTFLLCGVASLVSVGSSVFAPAVLHHVIDAFEAPQVDTQMVAGILRSQASQRVPQCALAVLRGARSHPNDVVGEGGYSSRRRCVGPRSPSRTARPWMSPTSSRRM